jgi:hypothetical protein
VRQYWVAPLPPFHIADGTANTGTTIADLSPAPPIVISANMLEVGSRLEFSSFGRYTTNATATTIVIGIYLAPPATAIASGNALAVTSAITIKPSLTNATWRVEGNASIRAVGSGTAAQVIGVLECSNFTSNGTDMAPATAPAVFGFDSTVANSVRIGATLSAAQSITCHYFGVRLVN